MVCKSNLVIRLERFVGCTKRKRKTRIHNRDRTFLLGGQFPYVHDQPLAVVPVVDGLHIHHRGLDPGLILSHKRHIWRKISLCLDLFGSLCQLNSLALTLKCDKIGQTPRYIKYAHAPASLILTQYITNLLGTCDALAPFPSS